MTALAEAAPILAAARRLQQGTAPMLLAIDGRCGSGKTTLAEEVARELGCAVVHMDDFYLPPAERAADWAEHPGANMDFLRLQREVLAPLLAGKPAVYRAYSCAKGAYLPPRTLPPAPLTLVEGTYCLHPALHTAFALRVFTTCTPKVQADRLQKREGAHFAAFQARWIPLEESYFEEFSPQKICEFVLDTSGLLR